MVADVFFNFLCRSLWFYVVLVVFGGYWWFLGLLFVSCCFVGVLGGF